MKQQLFPKTDDIDLCMLSDRHVLQRRLHQLKNKEKENKQIKQDLTRLLDRMEDSRQKAERRSSLLPKPSFPPELPISERWEEIA